VTKVTEGHVPDAVFGHVLEGAFEAQLEGQPLRKLKGGDTFYEPTMALHSVSRNPSKKDWGSNSVFGFLGDRLPTPRSILECPRFRKANGENNQKRGCTSREPRRPSRFIDFGIRVSQTLCGRDGLF
jgi:hypothetical protein